MEILGTVLVLGPLAADIFRWYVAPPGGEPTLATKVAGTTGATAVATAAFQTAQINQLYETVAKTAAQIDSTKSTMGNLRFIADTFNNFGTGYTALNQF